MIYLGLEGKCAVVSGAGYIPGRAGHGRRTAQRLAEAGATVACIDIDEQRAASIVAEIEATGGKALPVVADMTDRTQVERAMDEAVTELGGLHVCVDIIGQSNWNLASNFADEEWEWAIRKNLTQVFYLFSAAGRRMAVGGTGGSIVALASIDAIAAAKYHAPYGAAKAGVVSLVKSFADELGRNGIRVNAVAPGNVGNGNEDQVPGEYDHNGINPLAAPRNFDIANAVLFLASSLSERITGQTIVVDGGATIHDLYGFSPDRVKDYEALG